jgi:hypothetical protein
VTGSAFNVGVRFELDKFRFDRGRAREFTKRAESGNLISRAFCADCGSPLFTASPVHPEHIFVKAGSLDDPRLVRPHAQIWIDSAVPWGIIDEALPAHRRGRER